MLYAQERRGAKDYQIYHQCYQVHMIHPLKTVKILTYSKFHFPCLKFFPLNLPCQEYIFSFLLWIVLVVYHDLKAEYSPPIIFTVIWNYVELTKRISTPVLAVQQQEVWRVCFLEGFLLGLEWVLAHLLFLSMWQRYENWFFFSFTLLVDIAHSNYWCLIVLYPPEQVSPTFVRGTYGSFTQIATCIGLIGALLIGIPAKEIDGW